MPTPRVKPSQRHFQSASNQRRDWKDSPLIVAVVAAASTAVFFMTVVLPLRVDLLTAKVEKLTSLATEAIANAEKLEKVEVELTNARAAQRIAIASSPFVGRSVYPLGLDLVVLGTSVIDVVKRYPEGKWDDENSYFSVKIGNDTLVRSATYYFDGKDDRRKVSLILFHLDSRDETASQIVYKYFLTTFGEPNFTRRKDALWKATNREWVVVEPSSIASTFTIYQPDAYVALVHFNALGKK